LGCWLQAENKANKRSRLPKRMNFCFVWKVFDIFGEMADFEKGNISCLNKFYEFQDDLGK